MVPPVTAVDGFAHLRGCAALRGERWGESVARRVGTRRPWPAFEGRAREVALRKVADLSRDPELLELLAAELAQWAARRWGEIR